MLEGFKWSHVSLCDPLVVGCEPALPQRTTHFTWSKNSFSEYILISMCEIYISDLMEATLAKC